MQDTSSEDKMQSYKEFIVEGRNDVVKALANKAKTGGIDKDTFQKAHDLYKAAKLEDLKKLIKGSDTDVAEYIADIISRHDSKSFNSMYPRAKSGDSLAKIVREETMKIDGRTKEFREKLRKLAYEKYGKKKVDAIDNEEKNEAMSLRDIKNKKEREERRKKDGETRQQRMKRKVYGNMMGGLKDAVEESTAAYAASLERMANDKKLKDISPADRKTLAKLADLMKKANDK